MNDFNKVIRIGTVNLGTATPASLFCKIELKNGTLSITGVEGPNSSGNCRGSCGQIVMSEWDVVTYANGWNSSMVARLRDVWNKWHLNDLRAECTHQRSLGWTWKTHPSAVCPTCGYKLGHSWLREEVPADVLELLYSLPVTDKTPAWV